MEVLRRGNLYKTRAIKEVLVGDTAAQNERGWWAVGSRNGQELQ